MRRAPAYIIDGEMGMPQGTSYTGQHRREICRTGSRPNLIKHSLESSMSGSRCLVARHGSSQLDKGGPQLDAAVDVSSFQSRQTNSDRNTKALPVRQYRLSFRFKWMAQVPVLSSTSPLTQHTHITYINFSDGLDITLYSNQGLESQNERAMETGDPRENQPTSGIVRHDSHSENSGVAQPLTRLLSTDESSKHVSYSCGILDIQWNPAIVSIIYLALIRPISEIIFTGGLIWLHFWSVGTHSMENEPTKMTGAQRSVNKHPSVQYFCRRIPWPTDFLEHLFHCQLLVLQVEDSVISVAASQRVRGHFVAKGHRRRTTEVRTQLLCAPICGSKAFSRNSIIKGGDTLYGRYVGGDWEADCLTRRVKFPHFADTQRCEFTSSRLPGTPSTLILLNKKMSPAYLQHDKTYPTHQERHRRSYAHVSALNLRAVFSSFCAYLSDYVISFNFISGKTIVRCCACPIEYFRMDILRKAVAEATDTSCSPEYDIGVYVGKSNQLDDFTKSHLLQHPWSPSADSVNLPRYVHSKGDREIKRYVKCHHLAELHWLVLSQTKSWEDFITQVGNEDPFGLVYKMTAGKTKMATPTPHIRVNGELVEVLLHTLLLDDSQDGEGEEHAEKRQLTVPDNTNSPEFGLEEP
ncbi:hypothetical protein PR048_016280 [Dryococelus australis]|uniref:Uncharacterized protein n=1 Tax=Dryococelus australis TaxID=614101 RepID=A0ABQ9HKF4_9NEOP|nr:hypothetical protein PR048_016280 [Dryococelus australis]